MDNPIPPNPKRNNPPPDETEIDRLSELPDHLLLKILSLVPIKDAITTSTLSKRWQHLWTCLHRLRFTCQPLPSKRSLDSFASFVAKVLLNSRAAKITKFFIQVEFYPQYNNRINHFVHWALGKNVEKLLLDFQPGYTYANSPVFIPQPFFELGHDLCACSSLRTLYVSKCRFRDSGVVSWRFLTRLTMSYIVLDDGIMERLLSGCPVLERLELISFNGLSNLCVTNPNLRRLMLVHYWVPDRDYRSDNVLKITAPYVQELEISNCMYDLQCRLVDVSSLVRANIDFEHSFSNGIDNGDYGICFKVGKDLIQSVAHVKELTLAKWLLQVSSMLGREAFTYSLSNCKCLTLNSYMSSIEFPAVITLLNSSPQLETLVIKVDTFEDFFTTFEREALYHESNKKFLNSQDQIVKCLALHLKNVKIESHQYCCIKEEAFKQWENCNSEDKLESEYLLSGEELLNNEEGDQKTLPLRKLISCKEMFRRLIFEQDMCCKILEFLLMNGKILEKLVITSQREVCNTCKTCCAFEYLSLVAEKLSRVPKSSTGAVVKFIEKQP